MAITNQELVKANKSGTVVTSLGEFQAGDSITLKGDGSSDTGQITFNNAGNTAGTILKSGAVSSSVTFTLPTAHGSNGQVLSTSGNGVLTFSADSGITSVSADGNPTLSANLNVGSNSITSATGVAVSTSAANGNITFTPHGTGKVLMDGDGTPSNGGVSIQNGEIDLKNSGTVSNVKFYCEASNAHYTQLQSTPHGSYPSSGNISITLPAVTGTLSTQSYATGKAVAFSIVFGG